MRAFAQIDTRLHLRIGEAQTNFARTLPPHQAELAQQVLKDPTIEAPEAELLGA